MTGEMGIFFKVREDVYEYYGLDPWYLIEDARHVYWYKDSETIYYCEDKHDALASRTHNTSEYAVNITGSRHVCIREVTKDNMLIACIDNDGGGDPYYMVFDDLKNVELE